MNGRPLLLFPEPTRSQKHRRGGGAGGFHLPTAARQEQRIAPRFQVLQDAMETHRLALQSTLPDAEGELVVVFETVGTIEDFRRAVQRVPGLEWLADSDQFGVDPDEDFYDEAASNEQLGGYLYLVASNQEGLGQIVSLWDRWRQANGQLQFDRGLNKWKAVFGQLRDVRMWGAQDRLRVAGVTAEWEERVSLDGERVPVEVELWFRSDPAVRDAAEAHLTQVVGQEGGEVRARASIEEIRYHAVLAEMPIASVERVLALDAGLVKCEQVMFLRPAGQVLCPQPDEPSSEPHALPGVPPSTAGLPVGALLDGLPMENHSYLAGRLVVDDPYAWAAQYPARDRLHGTAMASLIIYGDLSEEESAIASPLYVRPILRAHEWPGGRSMEWVPTDSLPVDLVHGAVRRIFESADDDPPAAPSVRVVNLSVGDRHRLFDRLLTPWGRLLDWLAWKHRVLFVVSAGNHADLVLDMAPEDAAAVVSSPNELRAGVIGTMSRKRLVRRLLSPAETVNGLTVGAIHADASGGPHQGGAGTFDPLASDVLPSPMTAVGPGFRRAVKPDVCAPGGKALYRVVPNAGQPNTPLSSVDTGLAPGQLAASPGPREGDTSHTRYTRGTSNAAALTTRLAVQAHEVLVSLADEWGVNVLEREYEAVLLKALVVHSASWDGATEALQEVGIDDPYPMFGYGTVHPERVLSCTDLRTTLVGWGQLRDGEAHILPLPLPASLHGVTGWRRLTVTLAWLSPVHPNHQRYRGASLWFDPYGETRDQDHSRLLGVEREGADWRAVRRGTVQHEVFEGGRAVAIGADEWLSIQVNCASDAGRLTDAVPYGLAVTLEVAEEMGIAIYEEIAARVRPVVRVAPVEAPL